MATGMRKVRNPREVKKRGAADESLAQQTASEVDAGWWDSMESQLSENLVMLRNFRLEAAPSSTPRSVRQRLRKLHESPSIYRYRGDENPEQIAWYKDFALQAAFEVAPLIRERALTPKLLHRWGAFQFASGVISASGLLWMEDPIVQKRSKNAGKKRSVDPQRRWVARELLPLVEVYKKRAVAETHFVEAIEKFTASRKFPTGFPKSWFQILSKSGGLKSTYRDRKLAKPEMRKLIAMGDSDLPPPGLLTYPNLKVGGRKQD